MKRRRRTPLRRSFATAPRAPPHDCRRRRSCWRARAARMPAANSIWGDRSTRRPRRRPRKTKQCRRRRVERVLASIGRSVLVDANAKPAPNDAQRCVLQQIAIGRDARAAARGEALAEARVPERIDGLAENGEAIIDLLVQTGAYTDRAARAMLLLRALCARRVRVRDLARMPV